MNQDEPNQNQEQNEESEEFVYSDGEEYEEKNLIQQAQESLDEVSLQSIAQQFAFFKKQVIPIELLYIVFMSYRKDLQEIADKQACQVKITANSYIIFCKQADRKQEYLACLVKVSQFINTINYEQLKEIGKQLKTTSSTYNEKRKYNHSPYFQHLFRQKKIYCTYFNKKLYGFSRQLKKDEIKNQILAISKNKLIFNVKFLNRFNRFAESRRIQMQMVQYLKKMIQHYKDFFKERETIVEINNTNTIVYLIGEKPKYLMQSKQQFKNIIESLVGIIIKHTVIHQKQLIQYLDKTSNFPIHYAKLNERSFILISKDNILRQLIKKSNNFFRYTGIQTKINEQIVLTKPHISFFLIKSGTYQKKRINARNKCILHGYDFQLLHSNFYLRKVFFQDTENSQMIRNILQEVLMAFEESKDKFEVISSTRKKEDLPIKDENPLKYYIKEGKEFQNVLSDKLKRDVMTEKLQMKKQYLIIFNCNQGKQTTIYWILNKNGEEGEEIQQKNLKPGRYIRGKRRVSDQKVQNCIFQAIITVV